MEKELLAEKLTRKMSSGDLCHQRIFRCLPLLSSLTSCYMLENKIYNYPLVFLEIISEWNTQRLQEFDEVLIREAIFEIFKFQETINTLHKEYLENGRISFSQDIITSLELKNYKKVLCMCNLVNEAEKFNASKILHRVKTFKTKLLKVFKGTITLENFILKELIPQKEFINEFISHMKQFSTNQILIFILCYDIKHIKF